MLVIMKSDFQNFTIKSYVLSIYEKSLAEASLINPVHMTKICVSANFAYMQILHTLSKSIFFYFAYTLLLRISRICQKLKFYSIKVIDISLNSWHA